MAEVDRELSKLIAREEAKRLRNWDPVARWDAWLAAVAWAEQQRPFPRNSKEGCLAEERRWREAEAQRGQSAPLPHD